MNDIIRVDDLDENEEKAGALSILRSLETRIKERLVELNEQDMEEQFSREYEFRAKGLQEALDMIEDLRKRA